MKKLVVTRGSSDLKPSETRPCLQVTLNLPKNSEGVIRNGSVGRERFQELRKNAIEIIHENVDLNVVNDTLSLMIETYNFLLITDF